MVRSDPFYKLELINGFSKIPYTAVYGSFRSSLQTGTDKWVFQNPIHGSVWFVQILSTNSNLEESLRARDWTLTLSLKIIRARGIAF
jgi:hypothetical protein